MRFFLLLILAPLFFCACGQSIAPEGSLPTLPNPQDEVSADETLPEETEPAETESTETETDEAEPREAEVDRRLDCRAAPDPTGLPLLEWNHFTSRVVVASGSPNHSAQDIITTPARPVTIPGKFTYGALGKDLEDEMVEVWMDDCSGSYVKLGETVTDDDGRVAFIIEGQDLPPVGSYNLYLRVSGDDSATRSTLRVLAEGSAVVVFDIDATLTSTFDVDVVAKL